MGSEKLENTRKLLFLTQPAIMSVNRIKTLVFFSLIIISCVCFGQKKNTGYKTNVSIEGEKFYINGKPTFEGRVWQGHSVEGLLPNSRMVQGVFDDENPETTLLWKYPDTGIWDANRNTDDFLKAMDSWKRHGLSAFTVNMQGGSPTGYGNKGWKNPGYDNQGSPIPAYLLRMKKIIDKADELGMVVILGYFYFGQDQFLKDEAAVVNATKKMTEWVLNQGFTNVVIEIANEINVTSYDHDILSPTRVPELIRLVKGIEINGRRLLTSVSYTGLKLPSEEVVEISDFVLLHGNGNKQGTVIANMVAGVRSMKSFKPKPIVFNEDDHFDFDNPQSNYATAVKAYASWGYFDYRMKDEGYNEGFQSVPVNWEISSERKKGFFNKTKEIFID